MVNVKIFLTLNKENNRNSNQSWNFWNLSFKSIKYNSKQIYDQTEKKKVSKKLGKD
jgi:hypothetical protein